MFSDIVYAYDVSVVAFGGVIRSCYSVTLGS